MDVARPVDGHDQAPIEVDAGGCCQVARPQRAPGGAVDARQAPLPGGRADFVAADQRRADDVGDSLDLGAGELLQQVEVVFIAHDVEAKEVNEDDFFHKGEAGGTFVSSGYRKAIEVIADRYHPELWNIYAFHCSDGDNFGSDTPSAIAAAKELCAVVNLFGYGEIKPTHSLSWSSMLDLYKRIGKENFVTVTIRSKDELWPAFQRLLTHDKSEGKLAANA